MTAYLQCFKLPFTTSTDRAVVFSGYSGSYTSKTDRIDRTEILLKVALNTTTLTLIMI
jgi:hypothetical protein